MKRFFPIRLARYMARSALDQGFDILAIRREETDPYAGAQSGTVGARSPAVLRAEQDLLGNLHHVGDVRQITPQDSELVAPSRATVSLCRKHEYSAGR